MAKMQVNEGQVVRINGRTYKKDDVVEVDDATAKRYAKVFRVADKGAVEKAKVSDEVKTKREARKAASQAEAESIDVEVEEDKTKKGK